MNCVIVVESDCCTNNCSKAEAKEPNVEEYDAGESESDEEEVKTDKASVKTWLKFPDKWRP